MKKIIWNENGKMVITTPSQEFFDSVQAKHPEWTEEQIMLHIVSKDIPTGTKYEIVEEADITAAVGDDGTGIPDRTFRDAWEYDDSEVTSMSEELSNDYKKVYGITYGNADLVL